MSNCEKYLDMISAYADGEVTDTDRAELEAHLEECAECRSILETYREISEEIVLDTEEVPEGFSAGVMDKIASYEKNLTAKKLRRNFGVAGRWVGIAACIAIILAVFPSMPRLGCGASKDAAMENTTADAVMDTSADYDMFADSGTGASPAEPESAVDESYSYSDATNDNVITDSEESDKQTSGGTLNRYEIGMVVTIHSETVPEELENSDYEVTYFENGDVEYIVPVSTAREIAGKYDTAEIEELDTDIDGMMAKIIITK